MEAALCLCDLVRTTIGKRSTKCVQDNGKDFYTSETSMLLGVLDIKHPVGQFLVSVCQSFHCQHGSGVKTLLYMTGMFLRISKNLEAMGIPLDVIIKYLGTAVQHCCNIAEELKMEFPGFHCQKNGSPGNSLSVLQKFDTKNKENSDTPMTFNPNRSDVLTTEVIDAMKDHSEVDGNEEILGSLCHDIGTNQLHKVDNLHKYDNFYGDIPEDSSIVSSTAGYDSKTADGFLPNLIQEKMSLDNGSESDDDFSDCFTTTAWSEQNKTIETSKKTMGKENLGTNKPDTSAEIKLKSVASPALKNVSKRLIPKQGELNSHTEIGAVNTIHVDKLITAVKSSLGPSISFSKILNCSRHCKTSTDKHFNYLDASNKTTEMNCSQTYACPSNNYTHLCGDSLLGSSSDDQSDQRYIDNSDFISMCLRLSHGSKDTMKCLMDVLEPHDIGPDGQIRMHTLCIEGLLSQSAVIVNGLVFEISTDFSDIVKHDCLLNAVIINGDVLPEYRHVGHRKTIHSSVAVSSVISQPNKSWLTTVMEILDMYSVQCILLRGSASVELKDVCLAKEVLVLENIQYKLLQDLADLCGVAMVTYITDILKANLFDIIISPFCCNWVLKKSCHVIGRSTGRACNPKTVIMSHPSRLGCQLMEQDFQQCIDVVSSSLSSGYILPGYAKTEETVSQSFASSTKFFTDSYLLAVYEEVTKGLQEFVLTVRDNVGNNLLSKSCDEDVVDDYTTKLYAWQTAYSTAMTLLQLDTYIILDKSLTCL